jgi:hypothetical protein
VSSREHLHNSLTDSEKASILGGTSAKLFGFET